MIRTEERSGAGAVAFLSRVVDSGWPLSKDLRERGISSAGLWGESSPAAEQPVWP